MNKYYIVFFITLALGQVQAQSDTYKIENITRPEKLLHTVSADKLYSNVEKDFLKLSVTENLVDFGTHPVITGYLRAYQNHYPLTISPDIAWLLICQGFANHVNADPEKIRSQFVNFEGKKTLKVERDVSNLKNITDFQWETVFPEFAEQIGSFTGKELIDNLSADFTTTTPTVLVASQITIMESMKEFFNYKVTFVGCGISEVTVQGSVKDWQKILKRLDYLSKYDLEWWTSELKPVIQKIIDTKKGKLDKQFWMNMVKYHKLGAYGSYDGIDGWLLKFYPYLQSNSPVVVEAKAVANNGLAAKGPSDFPVYVGLPSKNRTLYLKRSAFKEIKYINELPKELANVPFILEIKDEAGNLKQSFNMEFWAGFMGVKQNPQTFNVKPEIGWAVNRRGEIPVK
ncbi:DUF4419 domain-containing protein [Pedobacter psychroterrae]|uniref:DUF4419 domain-containing protein n=1 Tax=Pedobacter psychroterrae TaxID=2530453 RepID=A0A4R0NEN6_9SPHI|nr:DUF4419 domain-containing protein [Pedobacter psychroterrae]TCC98919.1 DUF4419 domain-containing protein [Pedobacter psychroterrae]